MVRVRGAWESSAVVSVAFRTACDDSTMYHAFSRAEANDGPLVLGLDGIHVSIRGNKSFAVRGALGEVILDQRVTIAQPIVGCSYNGAAWGSTLSLARSIGTSAPISASTRSGSTMSWRGYRYLSVDYDRDDFLVDTDLNAMLFR